MTEVEEIKCNTPPQYINELFSTPKNIEAPLSPVLSSSKHNRKHISRLKSQMKSRLTQNFSSQPKLDSKHECVEKKENLQPTAGESVTESQTTCLTSFDFKIPESPVTPKVRKRDTQSSQNSSVGASQFCTGAGKKIELSDSALNRALKLFDDIPEMVEFKSINFTKPDGKDDVHQLKTAKHDPDSTLSPQFHEISDTQMCSVIDNVEYAMDLMTNETLTDFNSQNVNEQTLKRNCDLSDNLCTQETESFFGNLTFCSDGTLTSKCNDSVSSHLESSAGKEIKNSFKGTPRDCNVFDVPNLYKKVLMSANNYLKENISYPLSALFEENKSGASSNLTINETKSQNCNNSQNLNNSETSPADPNKLNNNYDHNKLNTPNTNSGFTTASGKAVKMSEESMKKARNLFNEFEDFRTEIENTATNQIPAATPGFQTASGKKVNISEKSLKTVRNLFSDCSDLIDSAVFETPKGFSTASGKNINVSQESVEKAKNIFDDLDKSVGGNKMMGFSTAAGNTVNVSEQSLRKAQKMFDETELKMDTNSSDVKTESLGGFSTASGQKVKISNEALRRARNLFSDVGNEVETPTNMKSNGFSTASGKKVVVSEVAMDKIKNIFKDEFSDLPSINNYGFSSAAKVSEDALEEAKHSFNNEFEDEGTRTPVTTSLSELKSKPKINKKSFVSPLLSNTPDMNDSTPTSRKCLQFNSRKRSLGMGSCRQIDVSESSMKKAKLLFEEDTPKKDIKTVSSPINATPAPKNLASIKVPESVPVAHNRAKVSITEIDNCAVKYKNPAPADPTKWKSDLQEDYELLKLKMIALETRIQAIEQQESKTTTADNNHRRQRVGHLLSVKSTKGSRISLREIVGNRRPGKMTYQQAVNRGVPTYLLDLNPENCRNLHFYVPLSKCATVKTRDLAVVVPDRHSYVGVSEIEAALKAMPGVDPSLVPLGWVRNHYGWIVWKLASLQRNFPDVFTDYLTIDSIVSQLKYRYDREIDRAQRSAVKKILEGDETPGRRLVLCVAAVLNIGDCKYDLELTDGWYSIRTTLDDPLCALVSRGLIKIGHKLMIHGAELLNCDGCPPLEVPPDVRLKVNYNSTRRAPWDAALGCQSDPGPFFLSLRSVNRAGGEVGALRFYVARAYPLGFMEKLESGVVWRNKRAEERQMTGWEARQEAMMERLQQNVMRDLEREWELSRRAAPTGGSNVRDVTCPRALFHMLESSSDPESFKELLTEQQCRSLQDYQSSVAAERESELRSRLQQVASGQPMKRDVCSVLKLLVVDHGSVYHSRVLNMWRPTDSHEHELREGRVVQAYGLVARNNGSLASVSRTRVQVDSGADLSRFQCMERVVTPICRLLDLNLKCLFGEFDTVGLVVRVDCQQDSQAIWISDEATKLLVVRVREGVQNCSLLESSAVGKAVAVLNLIYRKPTRSYAEALGNHYTVFTSFPQQQHLQSHMQQLEQSLPDDRSALLAECSCKVDEYNEEMLRRFNSLNPFSVSVSTPSSTACNELTLSDEELCHLDAAIMDL